MSGLPTFSEHIVSRCVDCGGEEHTYRATWPSGASLLRGKPCACQAGPSQPCEVCSPPAPRRGRMRVTLTSEEARALLGCAEVGIEGLESERLWVDGADEFIAAVKRASAKIAARLSVEERERR